ncbi:hypothetical protein [Micromonospora sp. LOL_023]|uniref:hypothetical protein n=1 Tax=Micromonospora sp. LOL_023 TaxID=3345418 RepID=UPI003A895D04
MIDSYMGPGRANGTTWHPPAPVRQAPAGAPPTRNGPPVEEQPDTQLEQAVRRAGQMRAVFYVVVLLVALTGQVTGATQKLDIHLLLAIPAVGALELGGVVVMANADVRRRLGERAIASRILSAAIAAGAVTFNWLAHDNHLLGGFFAGMSLLGYLVWLMHVENVRRDRLRAIGALPPTTPAYEIVGHWLRHPLITHRARSMAKTDPGLGLYGSLDAARAARRRERRDAAIAKVLRRKIAATVDPTTATIAVHVYDLDQIAARLANTADYDGLTNLIAADLTPTRIATPAKRPVQVRLGRWRTRAGRPSPATEPLPRPDEPPGDPYVEPTPRTTADSERDRPATDDLPAHGQPTPSAEPAEEHTGDGAQPPRSGPDGSTPTAVGATPTDPEPPPHAPQARADGGDEPPTPADDDPPTPGDDGEPPEVPGETAAAVAYWLDVDPRMGYDEIARRIGRTERTVRRNLPPGFRRPSVRGRT